MNIIESEIRQIFASIVWNHKIHEKHSDINSFWFNVLEFCKMFLKDCHFYTKFLHTQTKYVMLISDLQ